MIRDIAGRMFAGVSVGVVRTLRTLLIQKSLDELVDLIDELNRAGCRRLLEEHRMLFMRSQGSSHNHQNWPGGYHDHVVEVMNIAVVLYYMLSLLRPLPFSLSDALLVLFLHDLEKPWKYELDVNGTLIRRFTFSSKKEEKAMAKAFRAVKFEEYGLAFTPAQTNALKYVEGEMDDYSSEHRVMNELAAFCHICDVYSARIGHSHPLAKGDPWPGARRVAS